MKNIEDRGPTPWRPASKTPKVFKWRIWDNGWGATSWISSRWCYQIRRNVLTNLHFFLQRHFGYLSLRRTIMFFSYKSMTLTSPSMKRQTDKHNTSLVKPIFFKRKTERPFWHFNLATGKKVSLGKLEPKKKLHPTPRGFEHGHFRRPKVQNESTDGWSDWCKKNPPWNEEQWRNKQRLKQISFWFPFQGFGNWQRSRFFLKRFSQWNPLGHKGGVFTLLETRKHIPPNGSQPENHRLKNASW